MLVPKVDHMIEPILEFQRDKSRTALPAPQVEVVLDTSKAKDRGPDRVELRKVFFDGIYCLKCHQPEVICRKDKGNRLFPRL